MSWIKDPDAILDYTFNWSPWLNTGDSIQSGSFIITGQDSDLVQSGTDIKDRAAVVLLSGGTVGNIYSITSRIITVDGLKDDRTKTITISER